MRLWQREQVWVWLVGLEAIETAPNLESAKTSDLEAESPVFIDRPDFFDYPDSDQARLLALAQFTGESPVIFVDSGHNSRLFHHILVGALAVAAFFLLFQFCTHISCRKGS
ncbi:fertilization-influencing membrane protein isoform X2 [Manis javanica]|uniref:fertilization-influencing membrane protein isoform X2 n=1 Tax=Manis javanica TaxID=9974 RepID=UPI003C6D3C40